MFATLEMTEIDASPGSQISDEDLLVRYRETGDRGYFEQLVHRYERELYSYLRRYLNDAEAAEDVFQATFLQIHLKRDQFEVGRKFRPWLYTVATNQAIDSQRRNRRHRMISLDQSNSRDEDVGKMVDLLVSSTPDPLSNVDGMEQKEWVRQAVDSLPDMLRSVVVLVYYQGLKYRDAADVLGIPVGTVKSRLHTAIFKLNEIWNQSNRERNEERHEEP